MKKFFALFLIAVLSLSLALTGCGGKDSDSSGSSTAPPASSGSSSSGQSSSAEKSDKFNVANIVNGNLGDKSFFDSAEAGLKKLKDDGLIDYKTIELGGRDEDQPKWKDAVIETSESGEYDVIVCGTWQMVDIVYDVAPDYPDQKYLIYDTVVDLPNVVSINYKQNEMGYLCGIFAATLTSCTDFDRINEDKVIGFVGGGDMPVINDFLVGYIEGALAVDSDIKVDVRYTESFVDTALGKELATNMINNSKADVVWGVAGLSGNGAAEAANELDAWFIGVDSDQELTFTGAQAELAKVTLTSGLKNIGDSFIWFFGELKEGKEHWGEELWLGLEVNGVGVVTDKNFKTVPQEVQDATLKARDDLLKGAINVGSAFGDSAVDVAALRNSVRP